MMSAAVPRPPALKDCVERVCILAWREDTGRLEQALAAEGFRVEVVRATYSAEEMAASRVIRCLLNHRGVWARCAAQAGLWMTVEADFVPCRGLGSLPLPYPWELRHRAWAWLYAGGPRLYERLPGGGLRGHACATVAGVMGPEVAAALVDFADAEIAQRGLASLSPWDTYLQYHLKKRGLLSFFPFRQYGEHGGIPNPEHATAGMGQNGAHQADALWGPLHFLPAYAKGSRLRYGCFRARAKALGAARFLTGRFVEPLTLRRAPDGRTRLRLLATGIHRLLSPW
jgi:hypothetical protein